MIAVVPTELETVVDRFDIPGRLCEASRYGSGHINDTYLISAGGAAYVLQRINHQVFPDPAAVMDNVRRVCCHLRDKLESRGVSDVRRRALQLIPTREGQPYLHDGEDHVWRMYPFIERTRSYDRPTRPRQAYEVARGFGEFQEMVSDLRQPRLYETIRDFHHTIRRLERLVEVIEADPVNRAASAAAEIRFALVREPIAGRLLREEASGRIPERITHNDTKLNNVLLDEDTDEAICVIDLDTVMPGLALYDFGDLVRSVVNTAAEDEPDTDRVEVDMEMYRALTRGYLSAAHRFLTPIELEHLSFSAQLISYELGIRFLTDYLQGDTYFRIHRADQNLDRCRVQFRLVSLFEQGQETMEQAVAEAARGLC
ncbi:MAG: aminoglycoside phosphotransferase family protein [Armatimonadetes bacterium]|nr:aminoglycoside phosphotransferase family protein [Armatimonadota bacterium]